MPSCLGLYIEDNLIKYAKVSKNNEVTKVESFGVKFYETLGTAIKQIVEETYSFKVPISINSKDEWYNEIQVFSLLANKDKDHAIKTEFENICYTKDINRNIYEQRYIFADSYKGDDRTKVIHIAVPKTSIEQRKNQFAEYKINSILPLGVSIANLVRRDKKGTVLIVNIEKDTTITKIKNGVISSIETLNAGSEEILEKINKKENSYLKAYEICKSSTIYTESDKDLQYEENEYLEDIMPTLFEIVSQVRKTIDTSMEKIDKVYITGTGAIINNVDIYFQDNLGNVQCEILKPSFIDNYSKINIKDYIEVNSAIAIGLQALDKNNRSMNFKKEETSNQLLELLKSDVSNINISQFEIKKSLAGVLNNFVRQLDMFSITFLMITILYFAGNFVINNQFKNKITDVETSIQDTTTKIAKIQEYNGMFNSQTLEYKKLITSIENINNVNSENRRFRNTIPNLLNKIMVVIPKGVQLVSVENTSDAHIVIKARSTSFEQIAYFKAKLKTEEILENVVSDTGTLVDNYLNVIIEGELP